MNYETTIHSFPSWIQVLAGPFSWVRHFRSAET